MNFSNILEKMLDFQHYEYVAILVIFFGILVGFLQKYEVLPSSNTSEVVKNRSKKIKLVNLGNVIILMFMFILIVVSKTSLLSPSQIKYFHYFGIGLLIIKIIYDRIFKKEIEIIQQQNNTEWQIKLSENSIFRKIDTILPIISIISICFVGGILLFLIIDSLL